MKGCSYKLSITHDDFVVSDNFFALLATIINLLISPFIVVLNALIIVATKTKPEGFRPCIAFYWPVQQ